MAANLSRMFKDTLIYTIGGASRQLVGLILVPVYTRVFLPSEFGAIDLLTTATAFLTLLLQMGTDGALGRFFVDTDDQAERRRIASTVLLYLVSTSVPLSLLLWLVADPVSSVLLGEASYAGLVRIAAAALPFGILFIHFKNLLKWEGRAKHVVALGVAALVFQTTLTIILVVVFRVGLAGIYISNLVSAILFGGVGYLMTAKVHGLVFSIPHLTAMLRYGGPLVFLGLGSYVLTYSDRYVIQFFHGLEQVGLYGLGYKLASFIGLLFMGFQSALGPFVFSTYRDPAAPVTYAKLFDYTSVAYSVSVLALSLFALELVMVFGTQEYVLAYRVVPFIAASLATYTLGAYFAFGIGIARKTVHQAWSAFAAAGVNIALNLLLIPSYGIMGAAVATLLSYVFWGTLLMKLSQRYYPVPYRYARHFLMYGLIAALIWAGHTLLPQRVGLASAAWKSLLLAIGLTIPALLGLVGRSEITTFRRLMREGRQRLSASEPAVAAE